MIREVLTLAQLQGMEPEEAAALWTVRLAEGELPHDRALFEQWLELAAANRAAFEKSRHVWDLFDRSDGDELLEAMRLHARTVPERRSRWQPIAAAAALLVVALGTGSIIAERAGVFGTSGPGGPAQQAPSPQFASLDYVNGRQLPKSVTLPDGSRMTLDAETRVTARFGPSSRTLQVTSGRAFFAVQHNPSKPFVVRARDLEVTAIGTRFDVNLRKTDIRVVLVEGKLSVKANRTPGPPLVMTAGQQLMAASGGLLKIMPDTGEAPDWQQGYARFEDETLADAAEVLNRYPGDQLIVRDPRVASLRVTGNFKAGNAERFGRTLEEIYPVRVVRRGPGRLEVVPAG